MLLIKKKIERKKKAIATVISKFPDAESILKVRDGPGQPKIEEDQPDLLQTIINVAIHGSGADDCRRTEMIRTVKTLDDLHVELLKQGFFLSRFVKKKYFVKFWANLFNI